MTSPVSSIPRRSPDYSTKIKKKLKIGQLLKHGFVTKVLVRRD